MDEARPGTVVNAAGFQAELAQGNALLAAGKVDAALDAFRRAIGLAPDAGIGYYNLGIALRRAQEWREAVLAFRTAATRDARDFDAVQNVVTTLAAAVERDALPLFPRERRNPVDDHAPVSIVVCSVEPRKLEAMHARFTAALQDRPHEFIVIGDARS